MDVNSNIDEVIGRLRERVARLQDINTPLEQSGAWTRSYFVQRFTGSNDWAANSPYTIAQKGSSRPGIDSGQMRNSITSSVDGNVATVGTPGGTIGKIASWFQNGTGIFAGHSEWSIAPKSGKALAFKGPGGEMFFARTVTMQGQPARPFIAIDDTVKARVHDIFSRWVMSLSDGGSDAGTG
jgi:phage gpG-like protein